MPVIVLKLGRSAASKQFAISHSGALSGSNAAYDAAFARHGVSATFSACGRAAERLPLVEDRLRLRLGQLSAHLGDADWLDGEFSAGDLMMVSVLLRVKATGLLDAYPKLATYVARGEARPAYRRAFAAQWAING